MSTYLLQFIDTYVKFRRRRKTEQHLITPLDIVSFEVNNHVFLHFSKHKQMLFLYYFFRTNQNDFLESNTRET
jgi:hypothetical protein